MLPIVSSSSGASLEIVEMYKINGGGETAGKEILGHAFKVCLNKKKKKKLLSEDGNNFNI